MKILRLILLIFLGAMLCGCATKKKMTDFVQNEEQVESFSQTATHNDTTKVSAETHKTKVSIKQDDRIEEYTDSTYERTTYIAPDGSKTIVERGKVRKRKKEDISNKADISVDISKTDSTNVKNDSIKADKNKKSNKAKTLVKTEKKKSVNIKLILSIVIVCLIGCFLIRKKIKKYFAE